ncbi:MAG TPA: isoprenylcysteine carboxylmethyltransferase family protein [Acidobacteriota bacterium]|nr:isoprenylcysteine carboxylmethyltransferase family protein [Acidobacteriota bacterium]
MKRIAVFIYGVISYAIFFATFCYAYGWVGNILVPRSIDSAPETSLGAALLVNLALLTVFAVQHSVMARPAFKKVLTRYIPKPAERSTYVLFSSLAMIAMFYFWRPMGITIWQVEDTVGQGILYGLFTFGFLLVLVSTFLINHFDLFGLRQVWLYLRKKEYTRLRFTMPGPYKMVRHPLYVGWLFAFWATPHMTLAHLVFALATTAYILVAIQLEERDLIAEHGDNYAAYRRSVPMLVPSFSRRGKAQGRSEAAA